MYSVSRTIGVSAIFRSSVVIRSAAGQPGYSADIKAGVISDGWDTHMAQAGQLFLDPVTSGYDRPLLMLSQPKMVFSRETGANLSQSSTVPATDVTTITPPDLAISRLDVTSTDDQATMEFRLNEVSLPPVTGATSTDYNRIYLTAVSALVDYKDIPALGANGASEPGIVDPNVSGGGTFDPLTDLYVLDSSGGTIVVDGSSNNVWVTKTDLITSPVVSSEVVLAAIEIRNTAVDDIDNDIVRGTATAVVNVAFRIVI